MTCYYNVLLEGKNSFLDIYQVLVNWRFFLTNQLLWNLNFFKSTIYFLMIEHKIFSIQDSHILNLVLITWNLLKIIDLLQSR